MIYWFVIVAIQGYFYAWWRHQMETFSVLLAICAGNSPASGEFAAQRPVTRGFDVFFDMCLNKRLRKQTWGWWFETLSRPLWRHCNGISCPFISSKISLVIPNTYNDTPAQRILMLCTNNCGTGSCKVFHWKHVHLCLVSITILRNKERLQFVFQGRNTGRTIPLWASNHYPNQWY